MTKKLVITTILCTLISTQAFAINKYRSKSNQPSVEVNLIALRYLSDNGYSAPISNIGASPIIEEKKVAPVKQKAKKPKAAPTKQVKKPEPKKLEPVKTTAPKFIAPAPAPAPIIDIPPLPSFINETEKTVTIPAPVKIEKAPVIEAPKFTAPKFEAPKFEAPKFEAPQVPDLEVPKFTPPPIPKAPELPKQGEEVISVPELPNLQKEISANQQRTIQQRTITLPPPIFDDVKPVRTASNTSAGNLPSVNQLFDAPPPPPSIPALATIEAPSLIGKPALEDVQIKTASLPSLSELPLSAETPAMSVTFSESEVDFPLSEQAGLLEIISNMQGDTNSIVRVDAYASGTPDQASQAKRTALARALSVRKILKDREIESERIIIRPMGNKADSGVPDRVDIFLTNKEGA